MMSKLEKGLLVVLAVAGIYLGVSYAVESYSYAVADELKINESFIGNVEVERVNDFKYKIKADQLEGFDENGECSLMDLKLVKKEMTVTVSSLWQD